MMRIRYTGDSQGKDLALSGGCIHFPRGEWVDLTAQAEAAHVRVEHAEIAARSLGADWEIEAPKKSKKTDPAVPDEETDQ